MASIKILLYKSKKLKDNSHPIMMRLTHRSKLKYINLGHAVFDTEWNGEFENWIKDSHQNHELLNNYLLKEYAMAKDILIKMQDRKKPFTVEELSVRIRRGDSKKSFHDFTQELIDEMKKAGKYGNAECYTTTLNSVKRFTHDKDFFFEEIDYGWLNKYENHLYSRGNIPNTVSNYIRTVRAIFNKAIKMNIVEHEYYPFGRNRYEIPTSPTKKRAIPIEQIRLIESIELPENSLEWHARNMFMFSFYTRGMTWVDLAHLRLQNIINGRIEYVRIKTIRKGAKVFSIKITPKAQGILDIYTLSKNPKDYVFPIITRPDDPEMVRYDIKNGNKLFNQYLQKVAKKCGIDETITSYVARHSWSTAAKKMGYDVGIIADALGHSDPSITKTYLDSFGNEDLDKINEEITR